MPVKVKHSTIASHSTYDAAVHYASQAYQRSVTWISTNSSRAYSYLQDIGTLAKKHIVQSFNTGRTFFWSHKELFIGGAIIGAALLIIHHYWKNRPQLPDVKLKFSLDKAKLYIQIPEEEPLPPNATLTFCVDTSGSMSSENRLEDVKKSVKKLLDSAQKVIDASNGANIEIAIIGFEDTATVITHPVKITPTEKGKKESEVVSKVKAQVESLSPGGGTSIYRGIESGMNELEKIAKANRSGSHTIVLLTDGDDHVHDSQIDSIHKRLGAVQAKLFAIGIGKSHRKSMLEQIVDNGKGAFKGTYIDTTLGIDTIESAISTIYSQAIASFTDLELSSSHLQEGTWSVDDKPSVRGDGKSICSLGNLSQGEERIEVVKIHSYELTDPLDLSKVELTLAFKDPKGRQGSIKLPWKPNAIIDPEILKLV